MSGLLMSSVLFTTGIRYVRWSANGSTANASTHFNELQVLAGAVNRATSGTASIVSGASEGGSASIINNGNIGDYIGFSPGGATVQIDLGSAYADITSLKFWNYYADGRTYYSVSLSVSSDGVTFRTVFGPQSQASNASGISVAVTS